MSDIQNNRINIPIEVHLRDTRNGHTGIYKTDDYLEDGKFDAWFWIEGNYGCDCNRSIALYGLEVDESMPCNNGDNIIVIDKIVDAKTQKTLYIPEIAKE